MKILTTSYLKENMADIIREMPNNMESIHVTHNGEVKLIVESPEVHQAKEDAITMLMALNFTERQKKQGEFDDLDTAIDEIINEN